MEWDHTELCVFLQKRFCEEKIGEFPVFRPESTPEDSPEPHSGALPGKCAHAGKVPKYQNFQSWGIPKEFSSSNYRREEDREDFLEIQNSDDFLLWQFPHCNTGNTGSAKRG